jgi:hypothetical protein
MAYLYLRRSGRGEIRESHSTPRGPRSRTLASFRGTLTEAHLDRAEATSAGGFDREAIRSRARALGIPVARSSADSEACELIAKLRRGSDVDPVLVGVLLKQLGGRVSAPVPDDLAEVVEWIGASDSERGEALRGVLRLYDTIARSRGAVREPAVTRFPRFEVQPERRAS